MMQIGIYERESNIGEESIASLQQMCRFMNSEYIMIRPGQYKYEDLVQLSALIIPGTKNNVPPSYYNEEPCPDMDYSIDEYKYDSELLMAFVPLEKPILAICGGMQSVNVFFGGSLIQNIKEHNLPKFARHDIRVSPLSFLHEMNWERGVNSLHSQAVDIPGLGFTVAALHDMHGTIEAIERGNIICVQWHPELMNDFDFFRCWKNNYLT